MTIINTFVVRRFVDLYAEDKAEEAASFIASSVPAEELPDYEKPIREEFIARGWTFPEEE